MKKISKLGQKKRKAYCCNSLEVSSFITLAVLGSTIILGDKAIANNPRASSADYLFMVTSDWHNCQELGAEYLEVYAFETASFYVNICQKGDRYFFSSEAKPENGGSIFIPAYPVEDGRGYQANNGNTSYLVLLPFVHKIGNEAMVKLVSEATLTIERNNRLVLLESSLTKYCQHSNQPLVFDNRNPTTDNKRLATILPQLDTEANLLFETNHNDNYSFWQQPLNTDSRFDFYTVEGELHFLTTCS